MEKRNDVCQLPSSSTKTADGSVNKYDSITNNHISVMPYSATIDIDEPICEKKCDTIQSTDNCYNDYDRSNLGDIDPDRNYLIDTNCILANQYYNENSFNRTFKENHKFSMFLLNIRSLPDHFRELTTYLDCLNLEFKVIALVETWLKDHHTDYTIPNYTFEQEHRPKLRGGGVGIYLHTSLQYRLRKDLQFPNAVIKSKKKSNLLGKEVNSVFIEIDKTSTSSKHNIILGCIYRPPSFPMKDFNVLLNEMLDKVEHENKYMYILGDFNCNTNLHTPVTEEFKNIFAGYHLYPLINKPTRITDKSATLIDNIYCNIPNLSSTIDSGLLHVNISDHKGLFCVNNSDTVITEKTTVVKRSFTNKNTTKFARSLNDETWQCVYNANDSQRAFERFQGVIDQHFDTNFQMQTFTMNYKNRHPWMTNDLRKQIKNKNTLYLKTLDCPLDKDLYKEYTTTRNALTSVLKNKEISHYSEQLELSKNDIAKSWKVLKSIIGKDSVKAKKRVNFCSNNTVVTDNTEIANLFNNFFVSIGPTLAKDLTCDVNPMSYVRSIPNSIVVLSISAAEIRNVIISLKNSSPGWDEMPASVLKQCVDGYIEPLTHLINQSIIEGVFPKELKLARVVPLFKSGDTTQVTNYRPISVLTFFSKIFERIMYNYVLDFMTEHDIIYKYQFGFRQKHSTQQAIITLVEKITKSLDTGDIVIGVFLDLKKAFDTVDHSILLNKLHAYGIRGNILNWFASYLSERSQYVIYDGSKSEVHSVKCGVPQGSILGPLLFIIYMNDICNVSKVLFTLLYADDTCVIMQDKNIHNLIRILNCELKLLSTWLKANKLSLNAEKTYYLIFHRARLKADGQPNLYMNGCPLNKTSHLKYLGVIVDHKLNWIQHITYVKNKVSKGIGIMYKARAYLDKKCLANLYHTYIYPYLIYCIEVWGNVPQCHINPLLLIQKKIVRIITFSTYLAHTDPIFKDLSILPIQKLYLHRVGIFMYKYSFGTMPQVMSELYTKQHEIHSHDTRNANNFYISSGTDIFSSISARIWNKLLININVNVSFCNFKKAYKQFLQHNNIQIKYTK